MQSASEPYTLNKTERLTDPAALLIAGPTASGKSALAIKLAQKLNGTLINADSMQVYRDLRVLTARPDADEEAMVPHRLFGHVDGADNYSLGKWLEDAALALSEVWAEGRLPIFVGGTGMYFKGLTQGLSDIPAVPQEVRARVRLECEGVPAEILHQRLLLCDPASAARLRPSDPQRLVRALEVFAATGQSLTAFQGKRRAPLLDIAHCISVFLAPDRAVLSTSIASRFEKMLTQGALEEVEKLKLRKLDPSLPVMRAHGVLHLVRFLDHGLELAHAAELSCRDTRHYARRQFTFARHQLGQFAQVSPAEAEDWILGQDFFA